MELQSFIEAICRNTVRGTENVSKELGREIKINPNFLELDLAITTESSDDKTKNAGINVFDLLDGGMKTINSNKMSVINRVKLRIHINSQTIEEQKKARAELSMFSKI